MCKTLKRLSGEAMLLPVDFAFQTLPVCYCSQPRVLDRTIVFF